MHGKYHETWEGRVEEAKNCMSHPDTGKGHVGPCHECAMIIKHEGMGRRLQKSLESAGFTDEGGELWKPPVRNSVLVQRLLEERDASVAAERVWEEMFMGIVGEDGVGSAGNAVISLQDENKRLREGLYERIARAFGDSPTGEGEGGGGMKQIQKTTAAVCTRKERKNRDAVCPTCGPVTTCDEDGCCSSCGATVAVGWWVKDLWEEKEDENKRLREAVDEANAKLCRAREAMEATVIYLGDDSHKRRFPVLWSLIDRALSSTGPCTHEHHIAAHCPKPGHFSSPVEHGCKMCMDATEEENKRLREGLYERIARAFGDSPTGEGEGGGGMKQIQKTTAAICTRKEIIETERGTYPAAVFTYYQVRIRSIVLGEFEFQVSKEQFEKYQVGKPYTITISQGEEFSTAAVGPGGKEA